MPQEAVDQHIDLFCLVLRVVLVTVSFFKVCSLKNFKQKSSKVLTSSSILRRSLAGFCYISSSNAFEFCQFCKEEHT